MPILDLALWQISPNMFTCLKTLAVMIYPNQPDLRRDFETYYDQHASRFGRAKVEQRPIQKFLHTKLPLPIGPDYSQDGLYSTFIEKVSAGQKAGWMLWTAKRLYKADYRVDNVNRAADLLKKGWEAQNPGEAISQETLLGIWGDFQPVAHLWAAYWASGERSATEFSRFEITLDLPSLSDDFPAFLALANYFLAFGVERCVLRPDLAWAIPESFTLPDVDADMHSLSDTERIYLTEYDALMGDQSQSSNNGRQQLNFNAKNQQDSLCPDVVQQKEQYVFRKEQDFWTLTYEGKTIRLGHLKGLHDIQYLLQCPFQEVSCIALAAGLTEPDSVNRTEIPFIADGLHASDLGDAGEILDPDAIIAFKTQLKELRLDREEAERNHDAIRLEEIDDEVEWLRSYLEEAKGLGGRSRKAGSTSDRARTNIKKRIGTAIANIKKHNPDLADYLEDTIDTGHSCSYRPDHTADILWAF